eukprot:gene22847-31143_t
MKAFGDKCKYLQIIGEEFLDINGIEVRLKGILFDVNAFWMIKSAAHVSALGQMDASLKLSGKSEVLKMVVGKDKSQEVEEMAPFPLSMEYAGYKLAFEGKKIAIPTTDAIKTQLATPQLQLHSNNVAPGVDRKTWQGERCAK